MNNERIYIIKSKEKWGIYKRHSNRSIRNSKYRELAFHYAATNFPNSMIIVFNEYGEIVFTYNERGV